MKKRLTHPTIVVLLLLIFTSSAFAEGTVVIVGYKAWAANYEISEPGISSNSDSGIVHGPSITIRRDKFFFGFNRFIGEFDFGFNDFDPDIGNITGNITAEREETDIYLGMKINKNFSIIVGQKEYNFTGTVTVFETANPSVKVSVPLDKSTYKGNFIGVSGHTDPSKDGGPLYYFTVSQTKLEEKTAQAPEPADNLDGPSVEVGAAFVPKNSQLMYTISYKVQKYEGVGDRDDLSGISGGINYIFKPF